MKSSENTNTMFPIFLKPARLNILIVGGGNVAAEKLHFLLKSSPDANVRVIAPEVSFAVFEMVERHKQSSVILKEYEEKMIDGHDIVVAATDNTELNGNIWRDAKRKRVLINVADTPDLCDFYMGSIVTKGDLKLAISTNGKSPTFAKRFRELLEEILPDELTETLNNLHEIRKTLKIEFSDKVKKLNKLTSNLAIHYEKDKL